MTDKEILEEIIESLSKKGVLPFDWTLQESHYLQRRPVDSWLDYLIYRFKFRCYPERQITSRFPVYPLIEPTSVCNLRCVMCFQSDPAFTQKRYMGVMDLDLYKSVVDQAVDGGTRAITLGSRGEPTLHPKIGEMLKYLKGKVLEVKLVTNATKLTDTLIRTILECVDIVSFSIDGENEELYEKRRNVPSIVWIV